MKMTNTQQRDADSRPVPGAVRPPTRAQIDRAAEESCDPDYDGPQHTDYGTDV